MASNPICLPGLQTWTLYTEAPGTLQAEENGSCMPALATNDIWYGLLHFLSQLCPEQTNSVHIDHINSPLDNGFSVILFRNYFFGNIFFWWGPGSFIWLRQLILKYSKMEWFKNSEFQFLISLWLKFSIPCTNPKSGSRVKKNGHATFHPIYDHSYRM